MNSLEFNNQLLNMSCKKKELARQIINNNNIYTKTLSDLLNTMLYKELTDQQIKQFVKLKLLILKKQAKLCVEDYNMYFYIKKMNKLKFIYDQMDYESKIKNDIELEIYIDNTVKTICLVGHFLSDLIDEIQIKNIISEHDLCQILSLNWNLWVKNKRKIQRKIKEPKWSDMLYIYDCETVYNKKANIDKGFWNASPVYTALTEYKLNSNVFKIVIK